MRKDLYIFRHGETNFNKEKRIQGQSCNMSLNENGMKQAQKLAGILNDVNMEVIFASPLKRAYETALEIAKSKNIEVIKEPDLQEVNLGDVEGKCLDEISKDDYDALTCWRNPLHNFNGGECKAQAEERVVNVVKKIADSKYNIIGIASHGALISCLLHHFGLEKGYNLPQDKVFHITYENNKFNLVSDFAE
ncbi:MAG: histidine phosphatase family protein [Lactobacillus sp.]|jgi:broad specificity phosphatase PhoE|nr:histidine phosphatase family protein [Lactobacillus sp.]